MPASFGGYGESVAALFTGDYVFFLVVAPTPWSMDVLAVKTDLSGSKFWTQLNTELPIYGCIFNTDEADMNETKK